MTRSKGLTPAQVDNLNRVLRHLAEDMERRKAWCEAEQHADRLAADVVAASDEMARAG